MCYNYCVISNNLYPRGSEWRKWDLHLHAPSTKLDDKYKTEDGTNVLDRFCDVLEKSDVSVFGITDYFSYESFDSFIKRFFEKYPESKKKFFFNLELRLNETVNAGLEEVNIHLIFNPKSLSEINKFLSKLSVVKTTKNGTPVMCSDLKSKEDYESATVTRDSIDIAFEQTFGPKALRQDCFLVITAANNDGLRPGRGKKRKEGICDEIDKFSDGFFGGIQNIEYYLRIDRLEDKELEAVKKPVFSGSDTHSFDDIETFLGKRFLKENDIDGKKTEVIEKDITWIKSDPTFDGLKQTFYEPENNERIKIGLIEPDLKDDFKVIRKIKFNSVDFPTEIEFNNNLCSIIGSRSSGKSALLAYIAHSVDPKMTEVAIKGPGQGDDYTWDKIKKNHSIEWANGKTNEESPGNVLYVRQNYLFEKSGDSNEIKSRIEPVLFKTIPNFEIDYKKVLTCINNSNEQLSDQTNSWFVSSEEINTMNLELKSLGDKKSIEKERDEINSKIEILKKKNELSGDDIKKYQDITTEISVLDKRLSEINMEFTSISSATSESNFFSTLEITFLPNLSSIPTKLQDVINTRVEGVKETLLTNTSKDVLDYKNILIKEKEETEALIKKTTEINKELIEKQKKNLELEGLLKTLNGYNDILKKIEEIEGKRLKKQEEIQKSELFITSLLSVRKEAIKNLISVMDKADQSALQGIKFGIEYDFDKEDIENLTQQINIKEKTSFVEKNELKIDQIREEPISFLKNVFEGSQKITAHQNKKEVIQNAFRLTECILFTAEMEGDKIGGFSESTMTPGKRALFALRLILAESNDTWPLLIDQPEDDLDSRSIYDEVVPFLREKKKERQIIMVSHNANLVIGSDSEQLIVANRHGGDRKNMNKKQFNYLTGSLEFSEALDKTCEDTLFSQGVCEHACSILDGGKTAFENRKNKYNIK
jgi:ABC-type cobalamin/Fe3+-siderophores transport system ATPase subunit